MSRNELGIFLRERRGTKSLRDFSKELGISHTHLDSIEKGFNPRSKKSVNISVDTINKLSKKLGVSSVTLLNMASGTNYQKALSLEYAQNKMFDEEKRNPKMTEDEKDIYFVKMMDEFEDVNDYSFSVKRLLRNFDYSEIEQAVLNDKNASQKLLQAISVADLFCKFFSPLGKETIRLNKEYADKCVNEEYKRRKEESEICGNMRIDLSMLFNSDTFDLVMDFYKEKKLIYCIRQNYSDKELLRYLAHYPGITYFDDNDNVIIDEKKKIPIIKKIVKRYENNSDLINSLNKTKQRLTTMIEDIKDN